MSAESKIQTESAAQQEIADDFDSLVHEVKGPKDSASEIMAELEELWIAVSPGKTAEDFESEIHEPFDRDDANTEDLEADFANSAGVDKRELGAWPLIEKPIRISYGYGYLALLADACESEHLAWSYVEKASFWHGLSMGLSRVDAEGDEPMSISEVARKAAHARNAENRAIKSSAFEWLAIHRREHKSKDAAAEKLMQIVPVAFRTARKYVSEFDLSRP